MPELTVVPVEGLPEVGPGDVLAPVGQVGADLR